MKKTGMSRETLIDSQKSVHVTVMNEKNSDISSDEKEFKNMIVDDRGMEESDEVLSINSPIL